jgi:hypothetical protein
VAVVEADRESLGEICKAEALNDDSAENSDESGADLKEELALMTGHGMDEFVDDVDLLDLPNRWIEIC